jgi:nucleoside-diphosphate-sugar epimerase
VLHAAYLVAEAQHDVAVRVNAESTGLLMQHCRRAEAFVFVSASAVYEPQEPGHLYAETDPLGGLASYMPSYPVSKIATEGVVHAAARMVNLPSTIARMNIGYGAASHGGVPFGYDSWGSPISEVDIAEQVHRRTHGDRAAVCRVRIHFRLVRIGQHATPRAHRGVHFPDAVSV